MDEDIPETTPRDPERVDKIVELLREAWQLTPEFRLVQLVMTVADKAEDAGALWHVEDDTIERRLRAFIAWRKQLNDAG